MGPGPTEQPLPQLGISLRQAPHQGPWAVAAIGTAQQRPGRQAPGEPGGVHGQGHLGQGHRCCRRQAETSSERCRHQQQLLEATQEGLNRQLGARQQAVVARKASCQLAGAGTTQGQALELGQLHHQGRIAGQASGQIQQR